MKWIVAVALIGLSLLANPARAEPAAPSASAGGNSSFSTTPAAAPEPEPQLELGIGALALGLPDYRGADHYSTRVLPLPYVVYRSPRLQMTRDGIRAWIFSTESLALNISAAASLPGDADDNPARTGMPKLDPTFEAGPSLDFKLAQSDDGHSRTKLRFPVRAVMATDGRHFNSTGWTFAPHVRVDLAQDWNTSKVLHLANLGLIWSTAKYHDYFYGVAPEFANATRRLYEAHGGYSGARASLSSRIRRDRWGFSVFVSYDWLHGAVFDDSPLFQTEHAVVSGIFVSYRLYARGAQVPVSDDAP